MNSNKEKLLYIDQIVAVMPGNVYWKDLDGRLLGCNEQLAKLLGFNTPKDVLGKTDLELLEEVIAKRIMAIDQEVMRGDGETFIEEKGMNVNGQPAVYLTKKTPLRDENGKVIGLVGVSFDITDRKRLEASLLEAKEKAELALQAKEQAELESREKSVLLKSVLQEFKLNRYYLAGEYQGKYLTKREAECGYCLARGNTAKEIGNILHLSQRTVEGYLNSLREKLGAHTRSELISRLMACHFLDGVKPVF